MNKKIIPIVATAAILSACAGGGQKSAEKETTMSTFTGAQGEVKLMTLDPGHFHAALVQKTMYDQIDSTVYVYAPAGEDVKQHLARIESYNTRAENPTSWNEIVYTGNDYLEKMLSDKPGNVMVVAGNNEQKTEYIQKTIDAGINVFADKPMVITPEAFPVLETTFKTAEEKGVLLYDIMTERYEITTIVQRELSKIQDVFGGLVEGTPEEPAVVQESVHCFSKVVSGKPLVRPAWFFDTNKQGEGLADVGTHLVDLIQWGAFPEVILNKSDVQLISAKRWSTDLSPEQFEKVTGLKEFPEFLKKDVSDNKLKDFANGEMVYKLKGIVAKIVVIWDFEGKDGAGDTHYSIMRGKTCNIEVKQGKEENYQSTVYVQANTTNELAAYESALQKAVEQDIATTYPGLKLVKVSDRLWKVEIPQQFKLGHEAHFGQVTEKYLQYLKDGKLPEWEVPNMITKYYTTTEGMKMAKQ
ncbi:MAG: putative oxidoreductase C-terminal domain-containing protein [Prolixibacteraceae bacterium]